MTVEERLDRLTGIVESLAASVVAHDDQLEAHDDQLDMLLQVAEKHSAEIDKLLQLSGNHSAEMGKLIQISEKHSAVSDKHKEEMAEIRRSQAESARLLEAYLRRLLLQ